MIHHKTVVLFYIMSVITSAYLMLQAFDYNFPKIGPRNIGALLRHSNLGAGRPHDILNDRPRSAHDGAQETIDDS
jgi:hypothetical protein